MRFSASTTSTAVRAASFALLALHAAAQTYTTCNPATQPNCPADPALGGSVSIDFTKGASSQFTSFGPITYGQDGALFSISKSGDSPTITSDWYIMFGKVEVVMKASPGVGIVSSSVLQSDDLDEIDWEWLGSDPANVQTNYFGKGYTGTYDRGGYSPIASSQSAFNTYTIDWNAYQVVWSINGQVVRTLLATSANGQFPQSPMRVKIGSWSAGDPSNPPGTVSWAGGSTNYAAGPYVMQLKSAVITDYSTGKEYTYSGTSGTWQSIVASGGTVNPSAGAAAIPISATPSVAPVSNNQPPATLPVGTSPASSSSVPGTMIASTAVTSAIPSTITSLPPGWIVSSSGKSASPAATSPPASSSPAPSSSSASTPAPSSTTPEQSTTFPIPHAPSTSTAATTTTGTTSSSTTTIPSSSPAHATNTSATPVTSTKAQTSGTAAVTSMVLSTVVASAASLAVPTSTFVQVVTATGAAAVTTAGRATTAAAPAMQTALLSSGAVHVRNGFALATLACVVAFTAAILL